jgi:hypothetical protein
MSCRGSTCKRNYGCRATPRVRARSKDRTTVKKSSMFTRLIAAGFFGMLTLLFVAAPSASADVDTYLLYVQRAGISVDNRDIAIKQGMWICQALANGQSIPEVTQKIQAQNATLPWNQALTIVGLAQRYLC